MRKLLGWLDGLLLVVVLVLLILLIEDSRSPMVKKERRAIPIAEVKESVSEIDNPGEEEKIEEVENKKVLFSVPESEQIPVPEPVREEEKWETIRTTAYTHTESDHKKYGKKSASGNILRYGKVTSAASDWSYLPLGTEFQIEGDDTTYVIDDYGGALVGTETIDIYKPNRKAMNRWGVRKVKLKIIKEGSDEDSLKILEGRTKYSWCKKMYIALLAQQIKE